MYLKIYLGYLLLVNLVAFVLYGLDKLKAVRGMWRIPEASLLRWARLGGALGALLAMFLFMHKTRHKKFLILVPLFLLIWTALTLALFSLR